MNKKNENCRVRGAVLGVQKWGGALTNKKRKKTKFLISQVRCADLPAALFFVQTIHLFTCLTKKSKIDQTKNRETLKVDSRNGLLRKTPNGKRLGDHSHCH